MERSVTGVSTRTAAKNTRTAANNSNPRSRTQKKIWGRRGCRPRGRREGAPEQQQARTCAAGGTRGPGRRHLGPGARRRPGAAAQPAAAGTAALQATQDRCTERIAPT
ncbi:hypothetical protein U9M48_020502, partial [Paspalum notatum var. saurae]